VAGLEASLPAQLLTSRTPKVVFVLGPTGIGKSEVAYRLALKLGGEIVVADSRQVYTELDIATNKPERDWRSRVRYHMVDLVPPTAGFNVAEWVAGATRSIDEIEARGRLPIVEGGTMLYIDALTEGFTLAGVPPDPELRSDLARRPLGELVARLRSLDPQAEVDVQNRVRVVRAIEVLEAEGPPLSRLRQRRAPAWQAVRVGIRAERAVIDRRLGERSRRQVERGLVEEARRALEAGVPEDAPVMTGIGYAEALMYLRGEITLAALPERMAQSNRRYARRQLAWLKRDPRIRWFEAEPDPVPSILEYLKEELA
jgi:tRNA dimethylallyltransferase